LLGQIDNARISDEEAIRILKAAGLPEQALKDPTFPISLEQDLRILTAVRQHFPRDVSLTTHLFSLIPDLRIEFFGLLGLAIQSAPSMLEALRVPITYPQINWGRSHLHLKTSANDDRIVLDLQHSRMELVPTYEPDVAYKHGLLIDLVGTAGIVREIIPEQSLLRHVQVPFRKPDDWDSIASRLGFEVKFGADEAAIVCEAGFFKQAPKNARQLVFNGTMKMVEREASILAQDKSIADQVSRWLWAYTPPLQKAEVASLLGLSVRSLTRSLAGEGSSYSALLAQVQAERAVNLLSNPEFSIAQVAYRTGYSDPAAFTRAFVGWKGVAPREWRTSHFQPDKG